MAERVTKIIEQALALIQRERPDAYSAIAAQLDGLCLSANFEDTLRLESHDGALRQPSLHRKADIQLCAERMILLDLVRGRTTLGRALKIGRIELTGPLDALSRGLVAAEYFVGALLRIQSAAQLLKALEN